MQGNNTEYKSVTVANDATAEEFMDFYLDDPTRPKWVRSLLGLTLEMSCVVVYCGPRAGHWLVQCVLRWGVFQTALAVVSAAVWCTSACTLQEQVQCVVACARQAMLVRL